MTDTQTISPAGDASAADQMNQLLKQRGGDLLLKKDDLVRGVMLEKRPKQLFVDLGVFGTGIVYGAAYKNASDLIKKLEPGDEVHGKVVELENEDGYTELSLREAERQLGWERAQKAHDSEEVVEVSVTGYNRGGLVADVFGLQAFMPVSHLSPEKYPRVGNDQQKILDALREIVGQKLSVKVITVNQKTNKLIISEKAALEESVKDILGQYSVGDVVEGVVSGVVDFGAFVRFKEHPEIEGLVHLSELDHRLIDDPESVAKEGEEVRVRIIDIQENRVSLSLKALKDNPWDVVSERYQEGQTVSGEVVKFNPFGALVRLDDDFQGLIHVSEFGSAEAMHEALELGKEFPFVIQGIKSDEKRIVLVMEGREPFEGSAAEDGARDAEEKVGDSGDDSAEEEEDKEGAAS